MPRRIPNGKSSLEFAVGCINVLAGGRSPPRRGWVTRLPTQYPPRNITHNFIQSLLTAFARGGRAGFGRFFRRDFRDQKPDYFRNKNELKCVSFELIAGSATLFLLCKSV
jgi:hypothetical protein